MGRKKKSIGRGKLERICKKKKRKEPPCVRGEGLGGVKKTPADL